MSLRPCRLIQSTRLRSGEIRATSGRGCGQICHCRLMNASTATLTSISCQSSARNTIATKLGESTHFSRVCRRKWKLRWPGTFHLRCDSATKRSLRQATEPQPDPWPAPEAKWASEASSEECHAIVDRRWIRCQLRLIVTNGSQTKPSQSGSIVVKCARLIVDNVFFLFIYFCSSITEAEEVINKSFEERDEVKRVVSGISKCSEETEDDISVSKLIGFETLSLNKCASNDSWRSACDVEMCAQRQPVIEFPDLNDCLQ